MTRFHSLRWKLPLTYAGIALITALVSGGTLLAILRGYYRDQEQSYLRANAEAISQAVAPLLSTDALLPDLKAHMGLYAFLSQTHLRLFDTQKKLIGDYNYLGEKDSSLMASAVTIDSNMQNMGPDALQALDSIKKANASSQNGANGQAVAGAVDPSGVFSLQFGVPESFKIPSGQITGQPGQGLTIVYSSGPGNSLPGSSLSAGGTVVNNLTDPAASTTKPAGLAGSNQTSLISVFPLSGTMYGYNLLGNTLAAPRSNQTFQVAIFDSKSRKSLGTLEVSEGPAYGMDIVLKVASGWGIASLFAVLVAALAGWWISQRMSAPVLALTGAARQMADGNLSVRANTLSSDEFGEMARAFNDMAGQVEKTVDALRRFVSDAAHELHTPLTALHTNLDLMEDNPSAGSNPNLYLGQMRGQLNRLETLTKDLLGLSRIESGSPGREVEWVDLTKLVQRTAEPFASRAEQAGLDFELTLADEDIRVLGQERDLILALNNLLDNAIKFTPSPGKVELSLTATGNEACLIIADTGIGIPEADQALLFNRFHRGRNTAGIQGSGLGLAIVKAIIDQHAGRIEWVSSSDGTQFSVGLPRQITR